MFAGLGLDEAKEERGAVIKCRTESRPTSLAL